MQLSAELFQINSGWLFAKQPVFIKGHFFIVILLIAAARVSVLALSPPHSASF